MEEFKKEHFESNFIKFRANIQPVSIQSKFFIFLKSRSGTETPWGFSYEISKYGKVPMQIRGVLMI